VLGCSYEAAKKRYYRGNKEALEIIKKLVEAKESLINENSPKEINN